MTFPVSWAHRLIAALLLLMAACGTDGEGEADDPTTSSAPVAATPDRPFDVVTLDGQVVDADRDRSIPYRAYAPTGREGPVPLILVSHGGAGSDTGYTRGEHIGSALAENGYLTVHVGHRRSTGSNTALADRPLDVTHVLDQLASGGLALPDDFEGAPDLDHVGHTGHSYGAYTAHAVGGATFGRTYTDDRVDAIAPISPQGPDKFGAYDKGPDDNTWVSVTIPAYNLIGGVELDGNLRDGGDGWRLTPFRRYPGTSDTFVTILDGQRHSDMWRTGGEAVEGFITTQVVRFFDAYVAGDSNVDACTIGIGDLPGATTERRAAGEGSRIDDCS